MKESSVMLLLALRAMTGELCKVANKIPAGIQNSSEEVAEVAARMETVAELVKVLADNEEIG